MKPSVPIGLACEAQVSNDCSSLNKTPLDETLIIIQVEDPALIANSQTGPAAQMANQLPLYMRGSAEVHSSQPAPQSSADISHEFTKTTKESQSSDSLASSLANLHSTDAANSIPARKDSGVHLNRQSLTSDQTSKPPKRSQKKDSKDKISVNSAPSKNSKRSPPKLRRKAPEPQSNASWNSPHVFALRKGLAT